MSQMRALHFRKQTQKTTHTRGTTVLLGLGILLVLLLTLSGCQSAQTPVDSQDGKSLSDAIKLSGEPITTRTLLKDQRLRQALAMAFDKTVLVDHVLDNGSIAADYFVPQGLSIDEDGVDFRAANPQGFNHYSATEALALWEAVKADWEIETVSVALLTFDSQVSIALAELFKEAVEKTLPGVEILIQAEPFHKKLLLADQGDFDMEFTGWGPDYPDPMTFLELWTSQSSYNSAGYASEAYDNLIREAKVGELAVHSAQRISALQEAERLLLEEDTVVIPLYQRGGAQLVAPHVSGLIRHHFGASQTLMFANTTQQISGKKTIRLIADSDLPSMNSTTAMDVVSYTALSFANEGLVRLGEGDVILPGMAESWLVSEDGKTYTFNLRDAFWSNGQKVRAKDFEYAWKLLVNSSAQTQYNVLLESTQIKNYTQVLMGQQPIESLGVRAIDEKTLEVQLETPVPYLLKLLSLPNFYPLLEDHVKSLDHEYGSQLNTLIFNGPFMLSSWNTGYGYSFVKNPTYWNQEAVLIDSIDYRLIKDNMMAVNLFELGEIDVVSLNGSLVKRHENHPSLKTFQDHTMFYFVFNMN
jgi:oligopeptide transport system substrate-binding protein